VAVCLVVSNSFFCIAEAVQCRRCRCFSSGESNSTHWSHWWWWGGGGSDAWVALKKEGKGRFSSSWEAHLRAAGRHLPWDHTVLPATRHKWTLPA